MGQFAEPFCKGLRVLLVEDEAIVAMLTEGMLIELGCDAVVLAGSVSQALRAIEERTPDLAVLDVNLRGNFQMAQAVIPHLREKGGGAIVLMSSIAGQAGGGVFGRAHYAAAKAGLAGLAKALARELAPEGIRANAIAPGVIDNDFTKGRMTREIKDEMATKVPLGRLGTSEEVANVCLFLASDMSSYVTGTVISVNGGLLIA